MPRTCPLLGACCTWSRSTRASSLSRWADRQRPLQIDLACSRPIAHHNPAQSAEAPAAPGSCSPRARCRILTAICTFCALDCDNDGAGASVVAMLVEVDALPCAQSEAAVAHGDGQAGPHQRALQRGAACQTWCSNAWRCMHQCWAAVCSGAPKCSAEVSGSQSEQSQLGPVLDSAAF